MVQSEIQLVVPSPPRWVLSFVCLEHVRTIVDPEHPMTLEQLGVVKPDLISVNDAESSVVVRFTPTVNHCSMASLIGLCIRVKLERVLPSRFKIDVEVSEGSHDQEPGVNKQLNDKERVAAALENPNLVSMVNRGLVARPVASHAGHHHA
jgi:metal-sulfur cluster biosynthetic enzyme